MLDLFAAAEPPANKWPFVVLLISVAFIIVAITKLRLHAFIALIFAAFLAGFISEPFKPAVLEKLSSAPEPRCKATVARDRRVDDGRVRKHGRRHRDFDRAGRDHRAWP